MLFLFFFFNDTATTEIYTLSLHDALPICLFDVAALLEQKARDGMYQTEPVGARKGKNIGLGHSGDRKSTRLNSSHQIISYAVFCLKKKKKYIKHSSNPMPADIE